MEKFTGATSVRGDRRFDVFIGGGGFAGLALALALRQALGSGFSVAVADPNLSKSTSDPRSSAIAAAARRFFGVVGAWQRIAPRAEPIREMVITDSRLDNAVRPVFLNFAGEIDGPGRASRQIGEPFAHMVENGVLIGALLEEARAGGIDLIETAVADFAVEPGRAHVRLRDGREVVASLVVGADGARSRLREIAGIQWFGWDYGQSAIVTTVAHERPHHGRAEEHFLPPGPFAILPLTENRSSLVWTETTAEAERIRSLPDDAFMGELEKRFGLHLGELSLAGPRMVFPLGLHVARSFIADRLALIGDAAHVIHPIAGQGLNMGLRDAAALAEAVVDAARLGLDPGGAEVLERYQRWRRFDTMSMAVATDGLNRLFSNDIDLVRLVRDIGLSVVDRLEPLKRLFIREAAGLTGEVPKLLRGEAL